MTLRSVNETSRQNIGRGRYDRPAGSRDVRTQYNPHTEIVRLPAGSIVSIPRHEAPLEPLDLSQARFNKALAFALIVNFSIWGLLALAVWALFFAAF
jgi:hypothetical protein